MSQVSFDESSMKILKALALIYAAQFDNYPEERVKRIAHEVFALEDSLDSWQEGLTGLLKQEVIKISDTGVEGARRLLIPNEEIFAKIAVTAYMQGQQMINGVTQLHECMKREPVDISGLIELSQSMVASVGNDKQLGYELAIMCSKDAVAELERVRDLAGSDVENFRNKLLACAAYSLLGGHYLECASDGLNGMPEDNFENAIQAFSAGISYVGTSLTDLRGELQRCLAWAFLQRQKGVRSENIQSSITHYHAALTAIDPHVSPEEWAKAQFGLSLAYYQISKGNRCSNLKKSIKTCRQALSIFSFQQFPQTRAMALCHLGKVCSELTISALIEDSSLEDGMAVGSAPKWSKWPKIRHFGDRQEESKAYIAQIGNMEEELAAYEEALTYYTKDEHIRTWANLMEEMAFAEMMLGLAIQIRGNKPKGRRLMTEAVRRIYLLLTIQSDETHPDKHERYCSQIQLFELTRYA